MFAPSTQRNARMSMSKDPQGGRSYARNSFFVVLPRQNFVTMTAHPVRGCGSVGVWGGRGAVRIYNGRAHNNGTQTTYHHPPDVVSLAMASARSRTLRVPWPPADTFAEALALGPTAGEACRASWYSKGRISRTQSVKVTRSLAESRCFPWNRSGRRVLDWSGRRGVKKNGTTDKDRQHRHYSR